VNAQQPMRGWYPDPFGRYDERYFIDGHFTDRARLFIGSRARTFHDPLPGAIEIETLEQSPTSYQESQRASALILTLGGIGLVCLLIALIFGAFAHVSTGLDSFDCGTAFSPSKMSHAVTKQCNAAGLTANRTAATLLGVVGLGLVIYAVVRMVGVRSFSFRGSSHYPDSMLEEEPSDGSPTRTCPWCAETIKSAAVICRFCGRITPSEYGAGDAGADGFVFDPRRGAWTRVDVAARTSDADDVDDVDTVLELPVRPTALPRPPTASPSDVIDVDDDPPSPAG